MEEGKITNEQVTKIIEYLEGSTNTLQQGITAITEDDNIQEEDLTEEQLSHINQEIFVCSDCGWWCPMDEENKSATEGELGCRECNPDEDDEDED